ncbi:MAG: DUF2175 family protein [Thermoprotei archaeon]|nr:DUF2175 family protein [Thermoprotei archaeon]
MAGKWKCALCGGEIVEGQRFTFLSGLGAVHNECLIVSVLSKDLTRDMVALLDVNEVLLYAIIRFKEAEKAAETGEVKSVIAEIRRDIEKLAGRISNAITVVFKQAA